MFVKGKAKRREKEKKKTRRSKVGWNGGREFCED